MACHRRCYRWVRGSQHQPYRHYRIRWIIGLEHTLRIEREQSQEGGTKERSQRGDDSHDHHRERGDRSTQETQTEGSIGIVPAEKLPSKSGPEKTSVTGCADVVTIDGMCVDSPLFDDSPAIPGDSPAVPAFSRRLPGDSPAFPALFPGDSPATPRRLLGNFVWKETNTERRCEGNSAPGKDGVQATVCARRC